MDSQGAQLGAGPDPGPHPHVLHLPVHGPLVELHHVRRHGGHPLGHGQHRLVQFGLRKGRVGPALGHRLDPADGVTGNHHLHCAAHAQEPNVEVHIRHPEPDSWVAHPGVLGHVNQVAARRQFATSGEAPPVDLGDDRLGQVPDSHPTVGHVPGPLSITRGRRERQIVALVCASQVVTGREAGAGSPDDGHLDVGIGVVVDKRVEQRPPEGMAQGVALLRPIQGDPPNAGVRLVDEDHAGACAACVVAHVRWCVSPAGVRPG